MELCRQGNLPFSPQKPFQKFQKLVFGRFAKGEKGSFWENICTKATNFSQYVFAAGGNTFIVKKQWEEQHAGKGRDLRREYRQAEGTEE